jgi:hypothetical protein
MKFSMVRPAFPKHFDTALRAYEFLQSEGKMRDVSEVKNNYFALRDWQPRGERAATKGSPQGERGGVHQFYIPSCVVRYLVVMFASYNGRINDPAFGSWGSFDSSARFVAGRISSTGHRS